jgi:hypothetical protein
MLKREKILKSPKGIFVVVLGLESNMIYSSLNGCYSLLDTTPPDDFYMKSIIPPSAVIFDRKSSIFPSRI